MKKRGPFSSRAEPSQEGSISPVMERAPPRSPDFSFLAISEMAQGAEIFARSAKPCCRGQRTTAARWYQRSTVLPQLPM